MIGVYSEKFAHNNKPNPFAPHDLGMSSLSMALQATSMGLLFHQMAGFSPTKAREYFGIPEGFTPLTMIACGYPGEIEALTEKHQQAETAPRVRRSQEQSFLFGAWSK
jgi:nitroreductase